MKSVTVTAWEYCEFGDYPSYYFAAGEKRIEANSWEELAKKMGVKTTKTTRAIIFDHMGLQGWEMISAVTYPIPDGNHYLFGAGSVWHFKRIRDQP
jgi:hypothetical protein